MSKTVYEFNFDYAKCKNKYANYNKKAKKILKNEVVKDTDKFVPYKNGIVSKSAINSINSDNDYIIYKGPYARFLYFGHVMVGIRTNRPWAKKGETKIIANPKRALTFSGSHPMACARWFEKSRSINMKKWIDLARKVFK
mgnify:CR=1 FL=1